MKMTYMMIFMLRLQEIIITDNNKVQLVYLNLLINCNQALNSPCTNCDIAR